MEAVNGKSIGQRMRKGERFSSREILKTGIALSGILCYLHAQNPPVFYRDLKPDNVMITERGEIYLVDFGAAGTEETGVEVRYGTRGYAAPIFMHLAHCLRQWRSMRKSGRKEDSGG